MSLDVQYFTLCDHIVKGKQYQDSMCPKCYGRGYYLDIMFDKAGDAILTGGIVKLQQELIKVLLDEQGSDPFYTEWGSELESFIGQKNTLVVRSRLEMAVRRALERLQKIQQRAAEMDVNVDASEIIASIDDIQLEAISVTEWKISITITNAANTTYKYELSV